jgi:hypothetical protein
MTAKELWKEQKVPLIMLAIVWLLTVTGSAWGR